MFNSYYANIQPSQNVTINTPSSIVGTLVKSHNDSFITAVKQGSQEFNGMFGVKEQCVRYKSEYNTDVKQKIIILQTMLANDGYIYVEYVLK